MATRVGHGEGGSKFIWVLRLVICMRWRNLCRERMNVVLVHGFLDRASIMSGLVRHLAPAHACFAPTLKPSDARGGLSPLAGQLKTFVASAFPPNARFALIGYSMGAIIGRHYLQELGGA